MHGETTDPQLTSSHPAEAQSAQPNLNSTISQECLAITNLFCANTISKAAVILQIQGQLDDMDEHYENSLGSYIWILDKFQNNDSSQAQSRVIPDVGSDDEPDRHWERHQLTATAF